MFKRKSLSATLFSLIALLLLVLLVVVIGTWWWVEYNDYLHYSGQFESQFMQDKRERARDEVKQVLDYMQFRENGLQSRIRDQVQSQVDEMYTLIEEIYSRLAPDHSRQEILTEVRNVMTLFNLNRGDSRYYFIQSLDGTVLLFPPEPALEGTNILVEEKNRYTYVIENLIELARTQKNGFCIYPFFHPEKEGRLYDKLTYYRSFQPLNILIGTGEYLVHVRELIKEETIDWISRIRFGDGGYVFVLDLKGNLLSHIDPKYQGRNLMDYRNSEGFPVVREIIRTAIAHPEGAYLEYLWEKPTTGLQSPKLTFVQYYPDWGLTFGAGVFLDDLEMQLQDQLLLFRERMWQRVIISLYIFVLIGFLSLISVLGITHTVEKSLNLLERSFREATRTYTPIDPSMLRYDEFSRIATHANKMIEEHQNIHTTIEASLTEKETLLKEIHHRVKNNLQLISSILNLQSAYIDDDYMIQYFKESQNRIFTIASVHEGLYKSENLSAVDLEEYLYKIVPELINVYANSTRILYNIQVEKIEVSINTAIPIGLIVNEIITNSIQHAFPDREQGHIDIRSHYDGRMLTIIITDDGIGLPKEVEKGEPQTLGIQLIDTLIKQLKADYSIDNADGCRISIRIPEPE